MQQKKEQITSDQVLVHYNPDLPIVLTTDASSYAVSGFLSHKFSGGLKPIAFISRALSKSEINYCTLDKEALAIVHSVMKLKQYLLGVKFILQSDLKPLLGIFGDKDCHLCHLHDCEVIDKNDDICNSGCQK